MRRNWSSTRCRSRLRRFNSLLPDIIIDRQSCMHRILPALVLLLAGLGTAAAQAPWPSTAGARFLIDSPLEPVDDLTGQCRPPRADVCDYGQAIHRDECSVEDVRELGVFGTSQYFLVHARRARLLEQGTGEEPYTCASDELALVEMPEPGRARVVWEDATEREYVGYSSARSVSTAAGKTILSLLYCFNGTGGCSEGLLLWNGRHWMPLVRDQSWEWLLSAIPDGYTRHKSPAMDLGRLTHEWHLAGPTDPNCCPTGRAYLELALMRDALAVTGYRIVTHEEETAVRRLMERKASELHPSLPPEPLAGWLRRIAPRSTVMRWELSDCGEQTGDPSRDGDRVIPTCVDIHLQVPSRDREGSLQFDAAEGTFRFAALWSSSGEFQREVDPPSELANRLGAPIALAPLGCPEGTTGRERPSYAGLFEWCEDGEGEKHGPARSWFSTAVYLMERGVWRHGVKAGPWIECDRFERCARLDYE